MGEISPAQLDGIPAYGLPKPASPARDIEGEVEGQWIDLMRILRGLKTVTTPDLDEPIIKKSTEQDIADVRHLSTPDIPRPISNVIQEAYSIFNHRSRTNHKGFFSFTPANVTPLTWLGDVLVSAFNAHCSGSLTAAGPCAVETELVKWFASRIHFPSTAGGLFVSGGSIANMMAMTAARDQKLEWQNYPKGVIYIARQAHYSHFKAARILGFHAQQIRTVDSDTFGRLNTNHLEQLIQADKQNGLIAFLIMATFGYTETGLIDPLATISEIAQREGLWLHVDGAYGASLSLSLTRSGLARQLSTADSVSWDAHKLLFQTYGCGMLLVRDKSHLVSSFHAQSSFMDHTSRVKEDEPELWDMGVELTRPSRAMSLWFALRVLGTERIGQLIDHGMDLVELIQLKLETMREWEVITPASLGIITFRYHPELRKRQEKTLEKLNEDISRILLDTNTAAVMTVKVNDVLALRICCTNVRLTEEDVLELVKSMDEVARRLNMCMN
ncbi:pyridoxal phosphate-dependent decarboxylase family protein [Aspergillus affinis]|uniref:pyridoxal phosphate-dependent decarboxylase family protein n=1 Tax=Aspergillus affinis TaxID=1070780 RepID=UPI0022FEECE7|nr:PLP-dependent transferase [Aspergillus affinis]KAI9035859.1 PLP-dependent transferase [Aspergillus affinis]